MQYLQRGQRRAKIAKELKKQGKDIHAIAKVIGTTEERVKQILGNGIDYQGKK